MTLRFAVPLGGRGSDGRAFVQVWLYLPTETGALVAAGPWR